MSYGGQVVFGFTANGSALPEVESMARYTSEAFEALQKAAAKRAGAPRKATRRRAGAARPRRGTSRPSPGRA
jgi:hypothetical protein